MSKSKSLTFFALSGLFLMIAPGLLHGETVDRVVAVVNDDPITLYQVDKVMTDNVQEIKKAQGAEQKAKFTDYRNLALEKLIADKLLDQQMAQMKLQVTDEDVQKALSNIMQRNGLSKDQLTQQLSKKGVSYDKYISDLRVQLKKVKFMGQVIAPRIKVTDADLDEFFSGHSEQFSNYQSVQMSQVIIPLSSTASDAELAAAQAKAQEVANKAKGGGNFEDLAKRYSPTPQTAVPAIYQVSQLAPQIVEAISDLKAGEVSQPVRSELGIHVVKLIERKTLAGEEYKTVREQLREKVFEEKVNEELDKYVNELKTKSYIQVKSFS